MNFDDLSLDDRLTLLRFICSFAWADFEVQSSEKALISQVLDGMELDLERRKEVRNWLSSPPPLDDQLDPTKIPQQHRDLFLTAAWTIISADGAVSRDEWESYRLFKELSMSGC